jgi:hypothetical protein
MKRVRRIIATTGLVGAVTAAAILVGAGGSTAQQPANHSPQDVAQHILATKAARLMTAPARSALEMFAKGERRFSGNRTKVDAPAARTATGGQSPPTSSFTNVPVNDPSTDTHQVDQTTQSETSIAVAGSKVAVGYNDSQQALLLLTAGADLSGYGYSTDGGATWTDGGTIPNATGLVNLGDPWLTSDRAGNMYYSTLAIDAFTGLDVGVARSTNGGRTWSSPVIASPTNLPVYFADKDAMVAGPDPSVKTRDNLYATWDDSGCDDVSCFNGLPVARSTDGGTSWQVTYADKVTQDFSTCSFTQYIGAQPIVDPKTGTLFVAAEKASVDDPNCTFTAPFQLGEWIFRSTDGGQTFGAGVLIGDVTPATPDGLLKLGTSQYMRTIEFPVMAFLGNALYVAWNDGSFGSGGSSHIRLAKSVNDGRNWTLSWATQGTNDEVQPALSGDASGLHLLYYRRNPNNTLDVFVANSANGSSFVPSRVTTRSSPGVFTIPQFDPIIAFGYMGDYIANVSDGTHQYFAWGDNRDRVTNFLWPNGRNDPNVYAAKQ